MPLISGNGASAVLNDKLFVLTSQKGVPGYYRHFHCYDPAIRKWDELASPPGIHSSAASGVIDGIFYVVGGVDQDSKPIAQLDGYDLANDRWRTLAPMPTPRAYASGAVVDRKLYVIGGSAVTNNFAAVECYDPLTDSWTACPPMPSARNGLCAVAVNHLIYAIGGNARTAIGSQYIETVEVYDTRTKTWTNGPSLPHACGHGFALVHQNTLYVASGWSENRSWKTEAGYPAFESTLFQAWDLADTSAQPWSLLPPLPEPRYQGDGAVVLDGKICVIGGWSTINHNGSPDALPRAEIFQFDPSLNIWLKPQRLESPVSKRSAAKS
jgi:N-acetylneuraminic acid mutarotase